MKIDLCVLNKVSQDEKIGAKIYKWVGLNNYKRKAMRGSSGVDYSAKNFKLSVFLVNF